MDAGKTDGWVSIREFLCQTERAPVHCALLELPHVLGSAAPVCDLHASRVNYPRLKARASNDGSSR